MKKNFVLIILNIYGFLFLAWPSFSKLMAVGSPSNPIFPSPIKDLTIASLIESILGAVVEVGVVVVTASIIYAGFKYVIAQGNTSKINEAHKAIMYTIYGSAIVLGAYAIRRIVMDTVSSVVN